MDIICRNIINNLRNPHFDNKTLFLAFLPLAFLPKTYRDAIRNCAQKHWHKCPSVAHRLYWITGGDCLRNQTSLARRISPK